MTRTSRLDFGSGPDPDPAFQWEKKKRKLFSLAEVCALPSAILVLPCELGQCSMISPPTLVNISSDQWQCIGIEGGHWLGNSDTKGQLIACAARRTPIVLTWSVMHGWRQFARRSHVWFVKCPPGTNWK